MTQMHVMVLNPRTLESARIYCSESTDYLKKVFERFTSIPHEAAPMLWTSPAHPFINGGWVVQMFRDISELTYGNFDGESHIIQTPFASETFNKHKTRHPSQLPPDLDSELFEESYLGIPDEVIQNEILPEENN